MKLELHQRCSRFADSHIRSRKSQKTSRKGRTKTTNILFFNIPKELDDMLDYPENRKKFTYKHRTAWKMFI